MAVGWVVVVAAVMAITFVVVDHARRGVGQASAARTVASIPVAPAPAPGPAASPSRSAPRSTPTAATPKLRRTPTSRPHPTTPATAATVVDVRLLTRSFSTEGGTVVASCRGTRLSVDSIRPRDGWRFEQEPEHGGLEVIFKATEREVQLLLTCADGTPVRYPG